MIRLTAAVRSSAKSTYSLTREIAEDRARQAGLTLREWLEQVVILDDARSKRESLGGDLAQGRTLSSEQSDDGCETVEVIEPPGRKTTPLETAKPAIRLVQSGTVPRLDSAAGAQMAAVARFAEVVRAICADPLPDGAEADHSCTVEAAPSAKPIELPEAEASESRVVNDPRLQRLDQAQTRAADTLRSVKTSSEGLRPRLSRADAIWPQDLPQDVGIDQFLAGLLVQIDAMRAALATKAQEGAASRLDRIGRTLHQMCADAETAKQGAAQAVGPFERATASPQLNHRPPDAIEQLGAEVVRIAEAVELRFAQGEVASAQNIAELRAEASQLIEGLAARIADSERFASQALAGVDSEACGGPPAGDILSDYAIGADFALMPELACFGPDGLAEFDEAGEAESWIPTEHAPLDLNDRLAAAACGTTGDGLPAEVDEARPLCGTGQAADAHPGPSAARGQEPTIACPGTGRNRLARRRVSPLQTVMIIFGIAAGLSTAASGYVLVAATPAGALAERLLADMGHSRVKPPRLRAREEQSPSAALVLSVRPHDW
jgi:hypothetical protein